MVCLLASCMILNPCFSQPQSVRKIRLAIYMGDGAHLKQNPHRVLSAQPDIEIEEKTGQDIANGGLKDVDVLYVPGGSGRSEANSLGEEGRDAIVNFIAKGGGYVGICAGCYLATGGLPTYLGILPASLVDRAHQHWRRGKAKLQVEITPFGHEVLGVKEDKITVIYHNGPVMKASTTCGEGHLTPLAIYREEVVAPGGQVGVMINSPAMVLASYHKGIVVGISPHPEATPGLEYILPHVIRWLYSHQER
jgi:glutamine amidotransferase-like uncharacterized protein